MSKFVYVEMACDLDQKQYRENMPLDDIEVEPVENIAPEILFECYLEAFREGDAKFFKL